MYFCEVWPLEHVCRIGNLGFRLVYVSCFASVYVKFVKRDVDVRYGDAFEKYYTGTGL